MISLNEARVFDAIAMLGTVSSPDEVGAGAGALAAAMGMERYAIVNLRGATVAGLYHNAPAGLAVMADDPVLARARARRIPFTWGAADVGAWPAQHGYAGFRSGVVAAAWGTEQASCIVALAWARDQVPVEQHAVLRAWTLSAANALDGPLRQLDVSMLPMACPFAERERQCLLYALAGLSAKEAARALHIEARTVRQYLERARQKLQVKTSLAAAAIAAQNGWIDARLALSLADSAASARQA